MFTYLSRRGTRPRTTTRLRRITAAWWSASLPPAGKPGAGQIRPFCVPELMVPKTAAAIPIGGSRSLPESRIVTLRCRLAVVQCVRLPGQEQQGPGKRPRQ